MGGDRGSELIIHGALSALRDNADFEIVLLGPGDYLEKLLTDLSVDKDLAPRLHIEHAPETVSMHESPVEAVRRKKNSSIMVGFELVTEKGGNEPNPEATLAVVAKARELGLVILPCGYWGNTVRLLAPLTIPDEHLEEGLDMLEQSLAQTCVDIAA